MASLKITVDQNIWYKGASYTKGDVIEDIPENQAEAYVRSQKGVIVSKKDAPAKDEPAGDEPANDVPKKAGKATRFFEKKG